jgi:hypothetical protein
MVNKNKQKLVVIGLINIVAKIVYVLIVSVLIVGCLSYYNKVDKYNYDRVQDYVSSRVSGMSYLQLEEEINTLRNKKMSSELRRKEKMRSEIWHKLNILVNNYQKVDTFQEFYYWAVTNYDSLFNSN